MLPVATVNGTVRIAQHFHTAYKENGLILNIWYSEDINFSYPEFRLKKKIKLFSPKKAVFIYGVIFYEFTVLTEVLLRYKKQNIQKLVIRKDAGSLCSLGT